MRFKFSTLLIARTCHEANRAYCAGIGDHSQALWEYAADWQKESAFNGVKLHMDALRRGEELPPAASHEAWLEEKRAAGWKYGLKKDEQKKEHPCFVPYAELPVDQQMKDFLFAGIVKSFFLMEQQGDTEQAKVANESAKG